MEISGVKYKRPRVYLLNESGLGVAEFAGRTAYDSFDKSENETIKKLNDIADNENISLDITKDIKDIKNIESSKLLDQLSHVYHHDSVLEHITLSYLVKGTSRAVLQEHARHRIQSITVRSTRYTMSSVINAFISSNQYFKSFYNLIKKLDMFIIKNEAIEIHQMYDKINYQFCNIGAKEFNKISLSKDNLNYIATDKFSKDSYQERFQILENNKQKRNVGDNFKWIVTDNWKTDMVFTINLRSLKNYLKLRKSGAAYFQIRWLAEEVEKATPEKYLRLL